MKKRDSIVISFVFVTLILLTLNFFQNKSIERESVVISRVIDGDTLNLEDGRTIRLLNINSPEKDRPESRYSKEFLEQFTNKTAEFEIIGKDKYNRYLARIFEEDRYLNLELVKKGFASKFLVDKNELKVFDNAENNAVEKSFGIWKKSVYWGCLNVSINSKDETIKIRNNCTIEKTEFELKDESRKIFKINLLSDFMVIHSGKGISNNTDLYLNYTNVWNDDRDSVYILDMEGGIVFHESYGY
jgi:endonuclease YncB( thermonuclease family)